MKNPRFIHIETVESRAQSLVDRACPGCPPRVVRMLMPLLVRLVILEEQNA